MSLPQPVPLTAARLRRFLTRPAPPTLPSLLQSHALILVSDNARNPFFAAKLIHLYARFHRPPALSRTIFDRAVPSAPRDTFLWNSLLRSYACGRDFESAVGVYARMRARGVPVSGFTVPAVVSACAELRDLGAGGAVHGVCVKAGLFGVGVGVGSALVHLYCRCGCVVDARNVFDEMPARDVVSWTALIIGYVSNGHNIEALVCLGDLFRAAEDGEKPNFRTIEGGLLACGNVGALVEGKLLHCYSVKTGIVCCEAVKSLVLSVYSKCDCADEAYMALLELPSRDVVSWTSVVGAYARKGCIAMCLGLVQVMLSEGVVPDGILVSCLLVAAGNFGNVREGKALHGFVLRYRFGSDALVGNSLLSMYSKFRCLKLFENVFNGTLQKDAESWNHMIIGYGKMGLDYKCIEFFRKMQYLGLKSDVDSFVAAISSSSALRALHLGRSLHCFATKQEIVKDAVVGNSILAFYGNCRSFHAAEGVFKWMIKDIVSWNTLMAAYVHGGMANEALAVYDQMLFGDVKPNSTTFSVMLSACSDLAELDYGLKIHNHIKEAGLEFDVAVGTALVDMYAKCGQLDTSREIFHLLPEKDVISWNVMVAAYGLNGRAEDAVNIFREMEDIGVKPNEVSFLAALSACNHGGLVEEGRYLFNKMKDQYCITPSEKHQACMVDLLGRSGNLVEAERLIHETSSSPDGAIWGSLLGACCIHGDVEMGARIARHAIKTDPGNNGYYILTSNLYDSVGRWENSQSIRTMMKEAGVRKSIGWSVT